MRTLSPGDACALALQGAELIRQGVAFLHATVSSNGAEPFDIVVRMRMVRDHKQFAPRA